MKMNNKESKNSLKTNSPQKQLFKLRDFILIGVVLAIAILFLIIFTFTQEEGSYVIVRVGGNQVAKYSLSQNGEYSLNGGTNILKIEDGKAWMIEANCPTLGDTRCTAKGKISKTRDFIYCKPNNVLVTVYGGEEADVELIS